MKNYFKTLLNMFKAIFTWALDPAQIAITQTVDAWDDGINTLQSKCASIDSLVQAQAKELKGYAAHKKALKESVCLLVYAIIKPAAAFAKTTSNEILLAQVKLSLSSLRETDDSIFGQKMADLIAAVNPYIASLADYSVTPAMVTAAISAVNAYNQFEAVPRNKVGERKSITEAIDTMMKDTNDFVRFVLDPLAVAFKENNPDYYSAYRAMRKHVPVHNGTTKLRLTVINDVNDSPVPLATASISGTDLTGITDINGKCSINIVPKGIRTVTVSCNGFTAQTTGFIDFVQGDFVDVTVRMVPSFDVPEPSPENQPAPNPELSNQ